jgi:hypothetical protein
MQEGTKDWISEHAEGFTDDVISALTESGATEESTPLAELLRAMRSTAPSGEGWADKAAGLTEPFADVGDFLHEQSGTWDEIRSLFHNVSVPSLTGLDSSSPPSASGSSAGGDDWGARTLVLLGLGVFLLLVWKWAGKTGGRPDREPSEEWRLGNWPVSPENVLTREDLIRAFEYLALLRLGPEAGTHHHRDLADRLAEREGGDPARSRQAADLLAWLYEQARYAPADGPLSSEEIVEARHALRFLAGVTAA